MICYGNQVVNNIIRGANMVKIQLPRRVTAIVDDDLAQELGRYKWHLYFLPRSDGSCKVYAKTTISTPGKRIPDVIPMHHMVAGRPPAGLVVDHINGNTLDNRRENLRIATRTQNSQNSQKHLVAGAKSGYRGVHPTFRTSSGETRWRARIRLNGVITHLGYFYSEVDAAKAYDQKAREMFGSFARLNFPEEGEHPARVHQPMAEWTVSEP